ncbi:type II toxin-antitoxin system RelE/ParE family toxin [Marinobacter zhanjiangensis]|uniref:ParE toxin of type II toxin-antitoxin system, parDE n=1 Tax=Marinobacter zhanjiangensis TaxID=578215 RepID=A0ABQ3AVS9_9GAMM|nr:type II toxin-antitoxin system RelE/ParE family toxin [Marinobacter zhanjiangensis]GGY69300.1 hypothetical protein GCM10007071_15210 [Marinobacter zhanjiangensis]
MKHRTVRLTDEAVRDIDTATLFYDELLEGLGEYFFDSITTDIESLEFFAGVHEKRLSYYCCPAKRFPFLIYYDLENEVVSVVAILDTRRAPYQARKRLEDQ